MTDEKKPVGTPRKRLPRWMRVLATVVVLLILVGLILPYFLDVDRYRTSIAAKAESATGRKVSMSKIRARFLPHVGFVVEGFQLGNPPGFAEGQLLSADSIRGNLSLSALLHRDIQLSSIELVNPRVVLLEDEHGRNNYTFSAPGETSGMRKAAAPSNASTPREPFELSAIEGVNLTGLELTVGRIAGRATVPSLHLSHVKLALSNVALDPVQLKRWQGDANLSGVRLEMPGWKSPIELRSGKMTLRDGRVESQFVAAFGKAGEWKGSLQVADIERGLATFNLSTAQLDVEKLMAEKAPSPPSPPTRAEKSGKSELVAQGRVAAERIRGEEFTANNGSAEIRLYTDRAEVWPLKLDLYGGTLQVSARAERTQSPERFSANVQARNIDAGKLVSAFPAARGKVGGTGELDLQVFGALSDNVKKSLTGSGRFSIRDGKLPGLNLSGALETLARLGGLGDETPFSVLQGDLAIGDGRVSSKNIHLDSPRGTVDLHGSMSLDGALDYQGQAVVNPGVGGTQRGAAGILQGVLGGVLQQNVGRSTVPFTVRGTVENPQVRPGGVPQFETPGGAQSAQSQQPQKPKSILDLLRKQ